MSTVYHSVTISDYKKAYVDSKRNNNSIQL